jgi:hypothetical protein
MRSRSPLSLAGVFILAAVNTLKGAAYPVAVILATVEAVSN